MKHLALIFITTSYYLHAETIRTYGNDIVVKPFGYQAPRPPTHVTTVDLGEINLKFSAQQVCGYTDWSTAAISLPKQILSADYWKQIGTNLRRQAIDSVLAISGALPSMLACNASPTFCAILNKAEALAQANLKFTMDTCQVLEGLNDVTKSQFQALRGCVKNEVGSGEQASIAIDKCTIGDVRPEAATANVKMNNATSKTRDNYKSESLDLKICADINYGKFSSSSRAYTIAQTSCTWMKQFFPGVTLRADAKFRSGGTFSSSPAEEMYEKNIKIISIYLVEILDIIHAVRYGLSPYTNHGPKPRHLVITHPDVLAKLGQRPDGKIKGYCYPEDGSRCTAQINKLPPIYRLSVTGGVPVLMITADALFELAEAFSANQKPSVEYQKKGSSPIAVALEPLIQSVSYTHSQDVAKDALYRYQNACSDPDMQTTAGQEDCSSRIRRVKQDLENLRLRDEADRKHLMAQAQYYAEVEKIKRSNVRLSPSSTDTHKDPVKNPSLLR